MTSRDLVLTSLELNALVSEREAMKIANVVRENQGYTPAYGEAEFMNLAHRFRALKLDLGDLEE